MENTMKSKKILIAAVLAILVIVIATVAITASGGRVDPMEQLSLGDKFLAALDYDNAILAFTKAIEMDPMNVRAYVGRGTAYALSEKDKEMLAEAEKDFIKATELDSTNADAWLGLVDVYIRLGDFDKALETAKKGYEQTGDQRLLDKQKELESGNVSDSSGQVRRRSSYDGSGALLWYHRYTYSGGKKASVTSFDATGSQTGHVDVSYNAGGHQIIGYGWGSKDGAVGKIEYSYNELGQRIESIWYAKAGQISSSESFEYDANGRQIKRYSYDAQGVLKSTEHIEYDDTGRRIKSTRYRADGVMGGYNTWTYNSQGKMERDNAYDADGQLMGYTVYTYDAEGNQTEFIRYNADGTIESRTVNN